MLIRIEKFVKFLCAFLFTPLGLTSVKFFIWLGGHFSILYPRFTRSGRSEGEVFIAQNFIRDSQEFIE